MTNHLEIGLIGGVEKRTIQLVDYDANWLRIFEEHAAIIDRALGGTALQIEHIGSTSVPKLAAKPIIDILVVVKNSADEPTYLRQLQAAGYVLRVREPDWNEHRMLRTASAGVHVHIYSADCDEIERSLSFRDRLRENVVDRVLYEATKRDLAGKDWSDMNAYAKAKTAVIERIIAAAHAEGQSSHEHHL